MVGRVGKWGWECKVWEANVIGKANKGIVGVGGDGRQ